MNTENKEITRTEPVHTVEGPIRGLVEDGIATFRGIPYAAPPIGSLRWRAPAPVPETPWTKELDAVKNGPLPGKTRRCVKWSVGDTPAT